MVYLRKVTLLVTIPLVILIFQNRAYSQTYLDLDYDLTLRDWKECDPFSGLQERRTPIYHDFTLNFDYNERFSLYTYLFSEKDLNSGDSADFELFSGYITLKTSTKRFQAKLGRQMVNTGFYLVTVDGATLFAKLNDNLKAEIYGGVPEFFESDFKRYETDKSKKGDYSAGVRLIIDNFLLTHGFLNFYAEEENDRKKKNITAGIYKSFFNNTFALDGIVEYEDEVERITNFRSSFNFYPTSNLYLSARFSIYEPINYDWEVKEENLDDISIFNLLAWHDKSVEHSFSLQYNLSENFTLFNEFAFVNYNINDEKEENGKRLICGLYFDDSEVINLSSYLKYFYFDNSSGDVHGGEFNLSSVLANALELVLTLSAAFYDKINPDLLAPYTNLLHDETYTIELYTKIDIYEGLYASIRLEESFNEEYEDNLRFTARIGYNFKYRRE